MTDQANQTPSQNFDSVATIRAILEQSEKTRTERSNTELRLSNKEISKFLTSAPQDIRTPSPPKLVTFEPKKIPYAHCFHSQFRLAHEMKSSSLYTRLSKHESLSHGSIMNLTPLHSNRSGSSQPKSKRKMYKHSHLSKSSASVPAQICFERLKNSLDMVTERAANAFYNGEYRKCVNILNE